MRLLALTATALLGTGCFVSSTNTAPAGADVNLYWDFVRHTKTGNIVYDHGLGAVNTSGICPESDVDNVRVSSAAGTFDIPCTGPVSPGSLTYVQGAVVRGLPAGQRTITVSGTRNNLVAGTSVVVYQTSLSVNVPDITQPAVSVTADVDAVSAQLLLFGDLFSGASVPYADCNAALNPNISFDLRDGFGTLVQTGTAGCIGGLPAVVFNNPVDLDDYAVRMQGFNGSSQLVLDSCWVGPSGSINPFFKHVGSGTTFTSNLFANPIPVCGAFTPNR